MSSLRNLLNPLAEQSSPERDPIASGSDSTSSPITPTSAGEVGLRSVHDPIHAPHANCPDTLACLSDSFGRPQHTLPVILRCAILGSPRQRLTIREIYASMLNKYPYYATAGPAWKQSVRHHLSLNRLFERQPRPVTEPGFGSYWTVNLLAPPGTKRPRKRGQPNKGKTTEPPPPPRRRGRPRKDGRPVPPAMASTHASYRAETDEKHRGIMRFEDAAHASEQEMDSENDIEMDDYSDHLESAPSPLNLPVEPMPFNYRCTLPPLTPVQPILPQPLYVFGERDEVLDRLQIEMSNLRRQAAAALNASVRLQDQLTEAHAEISRLDNEASEAIAALRDTERMLDEESQARREAQQMANDEMRLRLAAENTLHSRQRSR